MLAIRKAKGKGYLKIHVLSNASEVIKAIKGDEVWAISAIILDITKLAKVLDIVDVSYILRK